MKSCLGYRWHYKRGLKVENGLRDTGKSFQGVVMMSILKLPQEQIAQRLELRGEKRMVREYPSQPQGQSVMTYECDVVNALHSKYHMGGFIKA